MANEQAESIDDLLKSSTRFVVRCVEQTRVVHLKANSGTGCIDDDDDDRT